MLHLVVNKGGFSIIILAKYLIWRFLFWNFITKDRMRRALIFLILVTIQLLSAMGHLSMAPSVVSAGGNYQAAGNLSISWTIGDLAITTLRGENLILTQGFQQPSEIGTAIPSREFRGNILVYPNPVKDELYIRFQTLNTGDYLLELEDVAGRILIQSTCKQVAPGDIVHLTDLPHSPGIYFLKLTESAGKEPFVTSIRKIQ